MPATRPPPPPTPLASLSGTTTPSAEIKSNSINVHAHHFMRLIAEQRALAVKDAEAYARNAQTQATQAHAELAKARAELQRVMEEKEAEMHMLRAERDGFKRAHDDSAKTLSLVVQQFAQHPAQTGSMVAKGTLTLQAHTCGVGSLGVAHAASSEPPPYCGTDGVCMGGYMVPVDSILAQNVPDQNDRNSLAVRYEELAQENASLRAHLASAQAEHESTERNLRQRIALLESLVVASSLAPNTEDLPDLNDALSTLRAHKEDSGMEVVLASKKRRLDGMDVN